MARSMFEFEKKSIACIEIVLGRSEHFPLCLRLLAQHNLEMAEIPWLGMPFRPFDWLSRENLAHHSSVFIGSHVHNWRC